MHASVFLQKFHLRQKTQPATPSPRRDSTADMIPKVHGTPVGYIFPCDVLLGLDSRFGATRSDNPKLIIHVILLNFDDNGDRNDKRNAIASIC